MIKRTSTKRARSDLFPFPASHRSHRKERGHKWHVSWLSTTFDSVSDVILIVSKLKREICEGVTESLSENHSKRVSGSGPGGEMYQEQQGRGCRGWHCPASSLVLPWGAGTPTPWRGTGRNRGCISEQGPVRRRQWCQVGTMDKPSWAGARLGGGWAGSRLASSSPGAPCF